MTRSIQAFVLCCVIVWLPTLSAWGVTIPTVPIGNANNAPDPLTGRGAVSYDYRIGTTEVTNAQYAEFLNAKAATSDPFALYHGSMGTLTGGITRSGSSGSGYTYATIAGRENMPVEWVDWSSAARFVNWLHNGQGSGDIQTGAYTIVSSPIHIVRNPGAKWFLPNSDEWYKAAYHKNDGATDNYFAYPTSSDTAPTAEAPPGGSNSANYDFVVGDFTDVFAYAGSASPYGTFDQGSNAREWLETVASNPSLPHSYRTIADGAYALSAAEMISTAGVLDGHQDARGFGLGFRVASVPEPSTAVLAIVACAILSGWSRRRQ